MLNVYDKDFNRLGIIGKFNYLLWRKRYSSFGEAELIVDATAENIALLQKENILYRSEDNEAMYIYYRRLSDDGKNDQLTVKCFSLSKWLDRRIVWGMYNFNGTPENIIRALITSSVINPSNVNRKFENVGLTDLKNIGTSVMLQVSYKNLFEKIEEICNTYEIGFRSIFNGNQLLFDVYDGVDRSYNQSVNQRVVLSKEFANVLTRDYEESTSELKNTALIGGKGEGIDRTLVSIENGAGIERLETFVNASNIDDSEDGVAIPQAEYEALLLEDGEEKLQDYVEVSSFDCELDVTKDNTKYGRDFYLGDIISIRDDKLSLIAHSRVVEVDEVFQNATKMIHVKVGKAIPTLQEKVKRAVKK